MDMRLIPNGFFFFKIKLFEFGVVDTSFLFLMNRTQLCLRDSAKNKIYRGKAF